MKNSSAPPNDEAVSAIVLLLGVVVVVFDITQQGGSFLHMQSPSGKL